MASDGALPRLYILCRGQAERMLTSSFARGDKYVDEGEVVGGWLEHNYWPYHLGPPHNGPAGAHELATRYVLHVREAMRLDPSGFERRIVQPWRLLLPASVVARQRHGDEPSYRIGRYGTLCSGHLNKCWKAVAKRDWTDIGWLSCQVPAMRRTAKMDTLLAGSLACEPWHDVASWVLTNTPGLSVRDTLTMLLLAYRISRASAALGPTIALSPWDSERNSSHFWRDVSQMLNGLSHQRPFEDFSEDKMYATYDQEMDARHLTALREKAATHAKNEWRHASASPDTPLGQRTADRLKLRFEQACA